MFLNHHRFMDVPSVKILFVLYSRFNCFCILCNCTYLHSQYFSLTLSVVIGSVIEVF